MVTFIVTVIAKTGHEKQVADFYLSLNESLEEAPGFSERKIYQAQTGTMLAAVLEGMSPEEREKFEARGHDDHEDKGTRFILIEKWASIDDRMAFGKSAASMRTAELIPHLMPEHTHEFYEEIS